MYHRIAEEAFDPWGLAVSPVRFREQLRWLSANRTVLPLTDFAAMHRRRELPSNALALTFDDGYDCVAEVAAPMLDEAGLAATVFLPAELIERGHPFWWDELKDLILAHKGDALVLGDEQIVLGAKVAGDGRWLPGAPPRTARQRAFQRIWAMFREKPPAEVDDAIGKLRAQSSATSPAARPMSPPQVRAMASSRIAFGSHALTHPWLTSLSSAEKSREIHDSIERCEHLTGSRPAAFAYPYGNFDAESERLVAEAGFTCACATIPAAVSRSSRLFALPRIQVGNWGARGLARILAEAP